MDGGYSAKHAANAGLVDTRVFNSSYLLTRQYVDEFQHEVKGKKPENAANNDNEDAEVSSK